MSNKQEKLTKLRKIFGIQLTKKGAFVPKKTCFAVIMTDFLQGRRISAESEELLVDFVDFLEELFGIEV